jgi:light-regulated signal transduction histidine kinase (bacteriophytochrome)
LGPFQTWLLQRFLGHNLPNHLVTIQGLARLVLQDQPNRLDEEGRLHLNRLADNASQVSELVRGLADLGQLVLEPGPPQTLDLAEEVLEARSAVKVLCPGCKIEYDLKQPLPGLKLAHAPWHQALVVLLRFLAERTPAGRPCRVHVWGQATAGNVEVRFEAPGLVLSQDELVRLFEPAGRGPPGLQLFPVRMLVGSWAGRLRVDSLPETGTSFVFDVPGC